MIQKLAKAWAFIARIKGFVPVQLPTGAKAFDAFCESILSSYDLPRLPSYKHSIATMIMHLGPTVSHKAPYFFAKSVRKAMANQTAYDAMQRIKEEEKKLKTGEATPETEKMPEPLSNSKVQEASNPLVSSTKGVGI